MSISDSNDFREGMNSVLRDVQRILREEYAHASCLQEKLALHMTAIRLRAAGLGVALPPLSDEAESAPARSRRSGS